MVKVRLRIKNWLLFLAVLGTFQTAYSQEDTDLFEMSLEELMNVDIVSASKKQESTFDAPVSSSVITRDEISRSGVTTIPEALRLSPGLIVRETTNGNYDVFVRGFDNLHRYGSSTEQHNMYTLVMIDNRPVFNYNLGGTYWESLPIDLIDIERIEIVRGPNAPLFGPNAVTGVINIITRHPEETGVYVTGNAQYGSHDTKVASASVGMKLNDKLRFNVSGNYQDRNRQSSEYYVYSDGQFQEGPSVAASTQLEEAYPNTNQAMTKVGVNAFLDYQATDHIRFDLSVGWQDAVTQRFNYAESMPLAFNYNHSNYVNLTSNIYGVSTKVSYNRGYDNMIPGSIYAAEYDFNVIDIVIDYQWELSDKLSLRPSFNYQQATYDDTEYIGASPVGGFFNGSPTVSTIAASLRSDYQITDDWRVIGALRLDKFNYPDDTYVSYQFASTYKLNDKYLFRAAHSRSNSGSFLNNSIAIQATIPVDSATTLISRLNGNPELNLATVTMSEVGFRGQLTSNLQVDLEVFQQNIEDIFSLALTASDVSITPTGALITNQQKYVNLPLSAQQVGATFSVNYVPHSRIQLRPFVTLQRTEVKDLPKVYNTLPISEGNPFNLYNSTTDESHESTPKIFGGAYLNAALSSRLNVNISSYFFGEHTMYVEDDLKYVTSSQERETYYNIISSKVLLNAKVSYRLLDKLRMYGTARNLLDNNSREHYGTDKVGRSFLGGVSYNF